MQINIYHYIYGADIKDRIITHPYAIFAYKYLYLQQEL